MPRIQMIAAVLLIASALAGCSKIEETPAPAKPTATVQAPAVPDVQAPAESKPDAVSPEFPGLSVATIDGATYDITARRGKWVVVNFWATWCAPCLKEMPELSALDAMREHIEVVGLAYEEIDAVAMRDFLKVHPVVYPIAIVDTYDPPADFDTPRGLPMTYLIAPDGRVAKKILGPVTAAELESAIASAGGPKAATALPGSAQR